MGLRIQQIGRSSINRHESRGNVRGILAPRDSAVYLTLGGIVYWQFARYKRRAPSQVGAPEAGVPISFDPRRPFLGSRIQWYLWGAWGHGGNE